MNQPISRRSLLKGSAAGAAMLGLSRFSAKSYAQIVGSNEAIRMGVVGFHGRGISHIDAWKSIKGVRLVALCEADEAVMEKGYAHAMSESRPKSKRHPATQPSKNVAVLPAADIEPPAHRAPAITKYGDVRKLIDDKSIDGFSIATPNHWHALMTVWGCQAGKDVYCEKPTCHEVWEGRQAVEAARKYNRIVQAGTQSRSMASVRAALAFINAGHIGKILVAHGLCYKRRGSIGKVAEAPPPPKTVDLNMWCGPAPLKWPHRKQFHYDWHWFWETGNGDIGNQGIHQMDVCRWAMRKPTLSPHVMSVGGRFGYIDDGQTPNTMFAIHNYGDMLLIFEVRGLPTHPHSSNMDKFKGISSGEVIFCEGGYVAGDADGKIAAYDKDDKLIHRFSSADDRSEDTGSHFANFIHAVRSRKRSDLNAEIEEGFISSALCHTSNISYRLGQQADPEAIKDAVKADKACLDTFERFKHHLAVNNVDISMDKAILGQPLKMDPKAERFIDNAQANALLTRTYRAPFVVPEKV